MEELPQGSALDGLGKTENFSPVSTVKAARIMALGNLRQDAGAATLASRVAGAIRVPTASTYLPLVLLCLSLLVYKVAHRIFYEVGHHGSDTAAFGLVALSCGLACLFAAIPYAAVPWLLRVILRGIGAFILVQVLFDAFGGVAPPPNILFGVDVPHVLFFRYAASLAVLAGMAGLWRPAFVLPLLFYYTLFRMRIGAIDGIEIVETDYLSLLDTGTFASEGALLTILLTSDWAFQRFSWLRRALGNVDRPQLLDTTSGLIWAVLVGGHLGNYFYSAIMKLQAGWPAPWTWLSNPTQTAILMGLERGDNPMATFPWLVQLTWDAIRDHAFVFNSFVLGIQLLSVVACFRVRTLALICLLFDAFHIGVYLTLGAMFHFWIVMNLIIYTSALRLREKDFTLPMKACCVAATLFGSTFFYTNYLGWLDSGKLVSTNFLAITRDGRELRVPAGYFGIYSYSIAQSNMYIPDNSFRRRVAGNNHNLTEWEDAIACGPEILPHQDSVLSLDQVLGFIRRTHFFMKDHPFIKENNLYYLYPQHMLPNPFVFTEFNRLKIDDIVAYKYVVDSVCLSLDNGKLARDVRKRDEYEVHVE
jgi:hypothetical protein